MVLIAGAALTPFNRRKDGTGFRDWAREAFGDALAISGLEVRDIDRLIVASESDLFTAQLNPSSILADDLGLTGAACARVEGGGASGQLAVQAAAEAMLAGTARRVAVVGFEAAASHLPAETVIRLYGHSFDAWTDGMTGVSATALYALSIQAFMARTGATTDDFARVAVAARACARANPNAHLPLEITEDDVRASPVVSSPYRRLDCSPLSDGAAALILAAEDAAPESRRHAPRIAGLGAASDRARLGDRHDPGFFSAKRQAASHAYAMAGIAAPAREIGLAEVYDPYSGARLQAVEALGLSDDTIGEARSGGFDLGGRLPVNPSGGLLGQGAPVGAVGVAQVASCALQLESRYHSGLQLADPPRFAVADTHGGTATTCAVTVLERGLR